MEPDNRKAATKALVTLASLEGVVLVAVVAVYFMTSNLTYLIGGVIGVIVVFGPLFFRWYKEHGPALKPAAGPKE